MEEKPRLEVLTTPSNFDGVRLQTEKTIEKNRDFFNFKMSQVPHMEVAIDSLKKGKILIRISDNGEGIEQKHLPRLFERFYRVEKTRNRTLGGSGLGLSIVKHIIDAHNEKIFVESQTNIGSEFSFTLPKANKSQLIQE